MNSHDNAVTIDTPQLQTKRELLTAAIRRTDHDLGWMVYLRPSICTSHSLCLQLNVVSPNFAPLEMVFLDETQVALIIDQDGDGASCAVVSCCCAGSSAALLRHCYWCGAVSC